MLALHFVEHTQLVVDQGFQCSSFPGTVDRIAVPPCGSSGNSWIEPVELGVRRFTDLHRRSPCGKKVSDQRVGQGSEVGIYRAAGDRRITGDVRSADDLAVQLPRDGEEANEGREIPHQSLRANLLLQVGVHVGREEPGSILAVGLHQGEGSPVRGEGRVKTVAQFSCRECFHVHRQRPAGQEIRSSPTQLACG